MNMNNKLLLKEIEIKSKLIQVLNDLIIEQNNQIDTYRHMITKLQDLMNEANNIMNNNYIDV